MGAELDEVTKRRLELEKLAQESDEYSTELVKVESKEAELRTGVRDLEMHQLLRENEMALLFCVRKMQEDVQEIKTKQEGELHKDMREVRREVLEMKQMLLLAKSRSTPHET